MARKDISRDDGPLRRRHIIVRKSPTTFNRPEEAPSPEKLHKSLPGYKATPLVSLDTIAKELGIKAVLLKDETNRLGLPSFKLVGASWGAFRAVAAKVGLDYNSSVAEVILAAQEQQVELFAATDGNHGRAVAWMARYLGLPATIFVPLSVDEYTRNLILGEGANLVRVNNDYDTTVKEAAATAKWCPQGVLVQDTAFEGYQDVPAWIIQGYATIFNEIDAQTAELGIKPTTLVAPVGVGSVAEAAAYYAKDNGRDIQMIGIEPDTAACLFKSLEAGESVTVKTSHTIMNGMDCGTLSTSSWPVLRDNVDIALTLSDYESHCAVQDLAACGISAGPCGAAGVAALRRLRAEGLLDEEAVVVLLCTEGSRPYLVPMDVSRGDLESIGQALACLQLRQPPSSSGDEEGGREIADYMSAWFQYRNIDLGQVERTIACPLMANALGGGTFGGKSIKDNGSHVRNGQVLGHQPMELEVATSMIAMADGL